MKRNQYNKKVRLKVKRILRDCITYVDESGLNNDETILFTINGNRMIMLNNSLTEGRYPLEENKEVRQENKKYQSANERISTNFN